MALTMNKSGDKGKETVEILVSTKVGCPLNPEDLENTKLKLLDDISDHFDKAARNLADFDRAFVNDKGKLTCTEREEPGKEAPEQKQEAEPEDKPKKAPNVA